MNEDYLQRKQAEFTRNMYIASQHTDFVRDGLHKELEVYPAIEQGLKSMGGDFVAFFCVPIPALWLELARRAACVSDREYDFLQAVGMDAMSRALHETRLTLQSIRDNAETFRAGIRFLMDSGKCQKEGAATLAELDQLLSIIGEDDAGQRVGD